MYQRIKKGNRKRNEETDTDKQLRDTIKMLNTSQKINCTQTCTAFDKGNQIIQGTSRRHYNPTCWISLFSNIIFRGKYIIEKDKLYPITYSYEAYKVVYSPHVERASLYHERQATYWFYVTCLSMEVNK